VYELESVEEAALELEYESESSAVETFWALAEPSANANVAQRRAVCLMSDRQRTGVISSTSQR
jgi:hypothetical protein